MSNGYTLEFSENEDSIVQLAFWDTEAGEDRIFYIEPTGQIMEEMTIDGVDILVAVNLGRELLTLLKKLNSR